MLKIDPQNIILNNSESWTEMKKTKYNVIILFNKSLLNWFAIKIKTLTLSSQLHCGLKKNQNQNQKMVYIFRNEKKKKKK